MRYRIPAADELGTPLPEVQRQLHRRLASRVLRSWAGRTNGLGPAAWTRLAPVPAEAPSATLADEPSEGRAGLA